MQTYKIKVKSNGIENVYTTKAVSEEKAVNNVLYNLFKTDYRARKEAEVEVLTKYSDQDLRNIRVHNLIKEIQKKLSKK